VGNELENVHSYWYFDEPSFDVDGIHYTCSEDYYHRQKPRPFDSDLWDDQRDAVMRAAVRHKFGSDSDLHDLLLSTDPHPLCSIKDDDYWGITPRRCGREHACPRSHGAAERRLISIPRLDNRCCYRDFARS